MKRYIISAKKSTKQPRHDADYYLNEICGKDLWIKAECGPWFQWIKPEAKVYDDFSGEEEFWGPVVTIRSSGNKHNWEGDIYHCSQGMKDHLTAKNYKLKSYFARIVTPVEFITTDELFVVDRDKD